MDMQDLEMKGLFTSLKSTVLTSSAPATTNKYLGAFSQWKVWAKTHREVAVFRVKGTEFALCLQHLGDTTGSKSAVEEGLHSMGWVHQLAGYLFKSDLSFVHMVLDGLQCKLAKPKVSKEAVNRDMVSALVNNIGQTLSLTNVLA